MATINSLIDHQTMDKIVKGQDEHNTALLVLDAAGAAGILSTAVSAFGTSPMTSGIVGVIGAIWFARLLVTGRIGNSILTSLCSRIGPLMASHADRRKMERLTNTGMMLNSASYFVSWIFTVLLFLNIAAIIQNQTARQNPLLQAATEKVKLAENTLENHQESNFKSAVQISADINQHAQILAQIEVVKQNAIAANASALSKWQAEVDAFWILPNSGQPGGNREIMDDDCRPKESAFGGGKMKTAARKLCPKWQKIQAREPVINSPEITALKAKLVPLKASINFRDAELVFKNAIINAYDALAVTEANIGLDKLAANGIEMVTAFFKEINPNIDDLMPIVGIILMISTVIVFTVKFRNQAIPEITNPRLMSNADIIAFERNTKEVVKTTWKDWFYDVLDIVRNVKTDVQTFSMKKKIAALVSFITALLLGLFLVKSYAMAVPLNASTNLFFTTLVCLAGIILFIFWLIWLFIKPISNNGPSGLIIDNAQQAPLPEPPDKPFNGSSDGLSVNWNFVNEWTEELATYQSPQNYLQSGNVRTVEVKPGSIGFLVPTEEMPICKWCKKPMTDGNNRRKYHPECAKKVKSATQKKRCTSS